VPRPGRKYAPKSAALALPGQTDWPPSPRRRCRGSEEWQGRRVSAPRTDDLAFRVSLAAIPLREAQLDRGVASGVCRGSAATLIERPSGLSFSRGRRNDRPVPAVRPIAVPDDPRWGGGFCGPPERALLPTPGDFERRKATRARFIRAWGVVAGNSRLGLVILAVLAFPGYRGVLSRSGRQFVAALVSCGCKDPACCASVSRTASARQPGREPASGGTPTDVMPFEIAARAYGPSGICTASCHPSLDHRGVLAPTSGAMSAGTHRAGGREARLQGDPGRVSELGVGHGRKVGESRSATRRAQVTPAIPLTDAL